jgi:hypothetical protein
MELKRVVLPFENERISADELKEHINFYKTTASEATGQNVSPSEQLKVANYLRKLLREEYHHYHLQRVGKAIRTDQNYINYSAYIDDALLHTVGTFSKRDASSFLYDVESYTIYHTIK